MLSDRDIAQELSYGELKVEPVNLDEQLQPCSLDVRVGDECGFYNVPNGVIVDTRETDVEKYIERRNINEDGLVVGPDDFFLVSTRENISIPDYLGVEIKGRSSMARLAVSIHQTGGLSDAGFGGGLVLEVSTESDFPVRIYPGQRIAQLTFHRLQTAAKEPYGKENGNKYDGQQGAVGSRIHEDNV